MSSLNMTKTWHIPITIRRVSKNFHGHLNNSDFGWQYKLRQQYRIETKSLEEHFTTREHLLFPKLCLRRHPVDWTSMPLTLINMTGVLSLTALMKSSTSSERPTNKCRETRLGEQWSKSLKSKIKRRNARQMTIRENRKRKKIIKMRFFLVSNFKTSAFLR